MAGKNVIARREKAAEREQLRGERNPEEQIALLDKRLGPGNGACKERARLQALISNP